MSISRWPDWMKRETVAAYADLRPAAVDQYVKRGLLPQPHKLGEALLWSRAEVDKAISGDDFDGDSRTDVDPYLQGVANAAKADDDHASAPRPLRARQG